MDSTLKPLVPSELNPPLNYTIVTDKAGLDKVQAFFKRTSVFVIDTETNMTETFKNRRIRTIQIGDRNEQFVIDLLEFAKNSAPRQEFCTEDVGLGSLQGDYKPHVCFDPIIATLKPVLESREWLKVGHNLQFDYEMLKWNLGIRMWNLYDTMWAEKVLYAGQLEFKASGIWALDDCVARYCGLKISKAEQTSFDLVSPLTTNQVVYCALDCRLPLSIKAGQNDKITKANLWKACQIEFDAIPAFADMKLNGIKLDTDMWRKVLGGVEADHRRNINKLDEFFLPIVGEKGSVKYDLVALENTWRNTTDKEERADARMNFMACRKEMRESTKHMDSYEGKAAINYGSNPQLLAALRKMGFTASKLPDTNDRSLKKSAEHPLWDLEKAKKNDPEYKQIGVIDTIRLYRETNKILTTYGEGFISQHVDPVTSRIHSSVIQLGAATGRTSSQNPNIQNIPRGSEWRSCFVAREGYKMITVDYNGCELRILAEYSQERAFIDAFLKDWDVHSVGAEILFGDEWKAAAEEGCAYYARHQKCKCKLHKELRDAVKALNFGIAYGMEKKKLAEAINKTEDYAENLLKKYRATFPVLIKYLDKSAKAATSKMESRTLSQRRRLYHKPTWADAVRKLTEEYGKIPTTKQVAKKYKGMFMAIEREGKNTPIQGTNADIAKIAMGCGFDKMGLGFMFHELETKYGAFLVNFVHDEFVVECPPETADACYKYIGDCMTRSGSELINSIPMTYEGVIDVRWKK